MNLSLILLLLPMLLVPLGARLIFGASIKPLEMLAQAVIGVIVVSIVYSVSISSQMADTEFLNGQVTDKRQVRVACSHSYDCRCRRVYSGTGSNRTSRRVCDTCYDHSNDWDWIVRSSVGNFEIDRVDRRGSTEPARWTAVQIGQPVALPHAYSNYVKAAPSSLFHFISPGDVKKLPQYPKHYDYQYADRAIFTGVKVPNVKVWNDAMAALNGRVGPKKQANIILIVTNESPIFGDRVRSAWLGGKKNDVVIVVGAARYPEIQWVQVFSWAKHDIVNVTLRNAVRESNKLDVNTTPAMIEKIVTEHYVRRPMADFEYLANEISPPLWVWIMALILGTMASLGAAYVFSRNDY